MQRAIPCAAGLSSRTWSIPGVGWVVLIWLACFLYVGGRLEPAVEHHSRESLFSLNRSFLEAHLSSPGGLLEYSSLLLAQLDYYNWLGAAVFATVAALLFVGSGWLMARLCGVASPLVPLTIYFLYVVVRNRYGSWALPIGLGLLLAISGAAAVWAMRSCPTRLRLTVLSSLSAVLCYLAGLWPTVSFIVFAIAMLLFDRRCQATTPGRPVSKRKGSRPTARQHSPPLALLRRMALPGLILLGSAVVWATCDEQAKALAQIDYYCGREEYDKVVSLARSVPRLDFASEVRLHLALFHTGQLVDAIFTYTNQSSGELLPGIARGLDSCRAQSQTLLELGLVNDAEHLAHEALEAEGNRPDLLNILAEVNLLKQRPKAARVFLSALAQIPFEGQSARAWMRDVDGQAGLAPHPELSRCALLMPTNDLCHEGLPTEELLSDLLAGNATNQMAFEYLMVDYLRNLELKPFVARLALLDHFNYPSMPRHFEEALLLYQRLAGIKLELAGHRIHEDTARRFDAFMAALARGADQTAEGRRDLARGFGDTYWFYYRCTATQPPQEHQRLTTRPSES